MVLSRCPLDNEIILWRPILSKSERQDTDSFTSTEFEYLRTFKQENANDWFLRFGTDSRFRLLASGTKHGDVEVFDMRKLKSKRVLVSGDQAINWITFSPSDTIMIGTCNGGSVWLWKIEL
jgi:WD40 repeat protein